MKKPKAAYTNTGNASYSFSVIPCLRPAMPHCPRSLAMAAAWWCLVEGSTSIHPASQMYTLDVINPSGLLGLMQVCVCCLVGWVRQPAQITTCTQHYTWCRSKTWSWHWIYPGKLHFSLEEWVAENTGNTDSLCHLWFSHNSLPQAAKCA